MSRLAGKVALVVGGPIPVDVTSETDVVAAMDRVREESGRLHVLVNAAGIELEKTVEHARYASGQLWVLDGALTAQVQQMRP